MDRKRYQEFQERLLRWFDANRRDLPWRRNCSAYGVWISEIMLQQTRVNTVVPYFERWMARFPTLGEVARASEEEILKYWEGLGYYSRARNIHKAAQMVVRQMEGEFPRSYRAVLDLPGIGPYTAGAVMSLAYGEDYPVVDGNVERALTRLFNVDTPVKKSSTRSFLWKTAAELIPRGEANRFNQALMELGALICLAQKPLCGQCPVEDLCRSRKAGVVNQRPVREKRSSTVAIQAVLGVIVHNGKVFIQKRPPTGLMAGLWEFPGGKLRNGEAPEQALQRELLEELELHVRTVEKITLIRHAYTSFRVSLHAYLCEPLDPKARIVLHAASEARWVTVHQLDEYAFPAANRKLIDLLKKRRGRL